VKRLRRTRLVDECLVATTDRAGDDAIVKECRELSIPVSRGDQDDVLDRYFRAAQLAKAEVVVRITSDCPLIDPEITDKTIATFLATAPDYASNALLRTYPRGLDTEVISAAALGRAWQQARKPYEREHVTPYIYEHPAEFKLLSVTGEVDYSTYRWTVDTPEDLEFVRAIYARLKDKLLFGWQDVLDLLDREPALLELNRSVMQKTLQS
jgi:spore coat polysaccharide biosynthesis protein SpsF